MKKTILLIIVAIYAGQPVFSQDSEAVSNPRNLQVGLTYSMLSGSGIYVISKVNERADVKVSGIFVYNDENSTEDSFFSLGADYQINVKKDELKRVYFSIGAGYDNNVSNDALFGESRSDSFFSTGVGMGIDIGSSIKGLIFNVHVTYQLSAGVRGSDRTRIGLGAGLGVGFNF